MSYQLCLFVVFIFEYHQRLYSQGWLAGNDQCLSTLFVQVGVMSPLNGVEQICRYPGDTVNAPKSCLKYLKLLNYAIYDKMTCMLQLHLLAVTIIWNRLFKIRSRNAFLAVFFITSLHPAP